MHAPDTHTHIERARASESCSPANTHDDNTNGGGNNNGVATTSNTHDHTTAIAINNCDGIGTHMTARNARAACGCRPS